MPIELTGIDPRSPSRLRLLFSGDLASGAFGTPAPAAYVVANQDGTAADPGVVSAIVVSGSPNAVELALDVDLVAGALYLVEAIGIPGADASTSTILSAQHVRIGVPRDPTGDIEPKVTEGDLLLYGRDLVWTGADYLETAEGDLATIAGVNNAAQALHRRYLGSPLPWAPEYSPNAREFVDVPLPGVGPLRARIEEQGLRDDRVAAVRAELVVTDDEDGAFFDVLTSFVGNRAPAPIKVAITYPAAR